MTVTTAVTTATTGAASKAMTWVHNRVREVSTWVGGVIVTLGTVSFPQTGIDVLDHYTPFVQHLAQFAGVAMAAMSTKHP